MNKVLKKFLMFSVALAACACEAKRTIGECMDEPNKRAAIYEEILTNSKYAHEFAHVMMMADSHEMPHDTAEGKGMISGMNLVMICAQDSVLCDSLADRLVQNNLFMQNMIERMYLEGAMDERCVGMAVRGLGIPHRPQMRYEGMGEDVRE